MEKLKEQQTPILTDADLEDLYLTWTARKRIGMKRIIQKRGNKC